MRDVGAIIVHHRNYPQVLSTIEAVLSSGVSPDAVVVVDNSEDPGVAADLKREVPDGVRLQFLTNNGYAAAVNRGYDELGALQLEIIIVSTHEVKPEDGALCALAAAVRDDPTVGVAGPTLLLPRQSGATLRIWSCGGQLSPRLAWPKHVTRAGEVRPATREWLDGALCAYRSTALAESLREDFFLYVEELEFHRRLRSLGWRVVWVPVARATQDTGGTPPYLQARNLQIFYATWGRFPQRWVSVPLLILRQFCVRAVRRKQPALSLVAAVLGWADGLKYNPGTTSTAVRPRHPLALRRF